VRVRYRQEDQACTLVWHERGAQVALHVPQRAITPGQFAVFYDGETCLGGAAIEHVAPGLSARRDAPPRRMSI
jgi:tRNA-specific 2-thiouridylase